MGSSWDLQCTSILYVHWVIPKSGRARPPPVAVLYCTYDMCTVYLLWSVYLRKMSSEIMAYSCSPWKTDLDSTLLALSFLNNRCFLTMEISLIEVTVSFR